VTAVTSPGHGTASVNGDNTVKYTPAAGYKGSDGFDYTASDGRGGSASAHVTVTVSNPANRAPAAIDDGR